jgi:DNA-binding MurR/RpiR family transcriptional regulator
VPPHFLQYLLTVAPKLSRGQRRVADFLYAHYDDAVFLPAVEIARRSGVSAATVTRLAGPLGFDGFPALRGALRDVVRAERLPARPPPPAARPPVPDAVAMVFAEDLTSLTRTHREADARALQRAAGMIRGARQIFIVGLRRAHALAVFLHCALGLTVRTPRLVMPGIGDLPEQTAAIASGDLVVAIGFAPYAPPTIEILVVARRRGARTLAITDTATSPLAAQADVTLVGRTHQRSVVDSYTAPLSLINALVTLVASRDRPRAVQRLREFERLWSDAATAFAPGGRPPVGRAAAGTSPGRSGQASRGPTHTGRRRRT